MSRKPLRISLKKAKTTEQREDLLRNYMENFERQMNDHLNYIQKCFWDIEIDNPPSYKMVRTDILNHLKVLESVFYYYNHEHDGEVETIK